jgi:CRP-like cAMP-binding protein
VSFVAPASQHQESDHLIDRIRHDIQERLDQLLAEVEKLRHALAALDPRGRPASEPRPRQRKRAQPKPAANPAQKATSTRSSSARTPAGAASSASGSATSTRTASGETRAKVLAALSSDGALTAADVAKATGLARPTVSTTLSRLAKSGEVTKADRGYRLPTTDTTAATSAPESATERL